MKYYLSVDIGASSGRHILSHVENGKLILEEIYRFENGMVEKDGHLVWDHKSLFENIVSGMKECKKAGKIPSSIGIDTWGVDYALIDRNGSVIGDVYAYRDSRTEEPIKKVHSIVPFEKLYERTGSQFQIYNTIYQLYTDKLSGKLDAAERFLMMPDFFNYLLTGVMKNEFTNASTTGLLSAATRDWDFETIRELGLPEKLFKPLSLPATLVGKVKKEIADRIGYSVDVVLPATHDTASAVMAIPELGTPLYISSGTWSLLGIEIPEAISSKEALAANFTNEGGYRRSTRFLKNIMGLWMIQSVRKEHGKKYGWNDYVVMAKAVEGFDSIVDVNDKSFLAPDSMIDAIREYCVKTGQRPPETPGEIALCVYDSLAVCYAKAIDTIEKITGRKFDTIHIVGGGCQNAYLNELTAKRTGRKIVAGPVEATAIGNALSQLIYSGEVGDIEEAKTLVGNSFDLVGIG